MLIQSYYSKQQMQKNSQRNKPWSPRPPNCRYYVEVRDGEDPIRAYRKIKKKMKDDKFIEEIKERQYYHKASDKRQERLKKRRIVLQRLQRENDDNRGMGGFKRQY